MVRNHTYKLIVAQLVKAFSAFMRTTGLTRDRKGLLLGPILRQFNVFHTLSICFSKIRPNIIPHLRRVLPSVYFSSPFCSQNFCTNSF